MSYEVWGEPVEFDDVCPQCDGGGVNDEGQKCELCYGNGFLEDDYFDDDYF
jgi:DnaJ-class molecular chaperone